MKTKLETYLDLASKAYYDGEPIMTDAQFDALADSIGYNKVGAKQHDNVEKHVYRMYSLQKYYEDEDKQRPLQGAGDLSISAKLDGAAISILYVNGELARVLTRGDGIEGQVVTDKFIDNPIIPQRLENVPSLLQVTGEIVAPLNIENARNYAAGSLNLKDASEFKQRALSFYAYGVEPRVDPSHDTYDRDMAALARRGFNTVQATDLDKIFPTDGVVFRVNSYKTFLEMGYTAKHPRGAYALKERGAHVETKLLDVEWQVGKSGKVTPVAILEPVMIGDAVVSRATLNNPGFIQALGIQIGDTLAVIRSGEIIPCVLHKVDA